MAYRVEITKPAAASIRKLQRAMQARVLQAIMGLRFNPRPHGVKKLNGPGEFYRIRVGNFRVVYTIDDAIRLVVVVKVADRKDVYD
jgi:mRNA interferase RelE/StbE